MAHIFGAEGARAKRSQIRSFSLLDDLAGAMGLDMGALRHRKNSGSQPGGTPSLKFPFSCSSARGGEGGSWLSSSQLCHSSTALPTGRRWLRCAAVSLPEASATRTIHLSVVGPPAHVRMGFARAACR